MAEYQGIVERQPNTGPRLPEPNRLSADRGWHWIMDAFRLVKPHFGVWFLLCLIFFIIMMVMSAVPAGSFGWMLLSGAKSQKSPTCSSASNIIPHSWR